jgi:hypothetical protein
MRRGLVLVVERPSLVGRNQWEKTPQDKTETPLIYFIVY